MIVSCLYRYAYFMHLSRENINNIHKPSQGSMYIGQPVNEDESYESTDIDGSCCMVGN